MKVQCFHCKKVNEFPNKIGLRDECEFCKSDIHVCKNCEHYDTKVYNECRETTADVVRDKERSNHCDYYVVRSSINSADDQKAKLKAAADALFKK